MATLKQAVDDFLAQKRIAVAGVSRSPDQSANLIYRTLRKAKHEVFAINPNAEEVEGDPCFADLHSIPGGVDAVVIATAPSVSLSIAEECAREGVSRVWMHRSFGAGSVSKDAADYCREHNITVIPGGCPMMFLAEGDVGHKCMGWMLKVTGGLPREV